MTPEENIDENKETVVKHLLEKPNRFLFNFIFIIAIGISVSMGALTVWQMNQTSILNSFVACTHKIIHVASDTKYNLINAETLQRAYLLSNDKKYLDQFHQAIPIINSNINELVDITKDNQTQFNKTSKIKTETLQRISVLEELANLHTQQNKITPDQIQILQQGQALSSHIKESLDEVINEENSILSDRIAKANDATDASLSIVVFGKSISLIFLVAAFVLFNFELNKRIQADNKRKAYENYLKNVIEGSHDMIAALDMNYRFFIFNEAYRKEFFKIFGKTITVGMSIKDILYENNSQEEKVLNLWKKSFKGGEFKEIVDLVSTNSREIYEVSSSMIKKNKHELFGVVHILRNITKSVNEQEQLKSEHALLSAGILELQERNSKITQVVEMNETMLACKNIKELSDVITAYCQKIFPRTNGILYIMHPSKNYLECMKGWGYTDEQQLGFGNQTCWALKLGRLHKTIYAQNELRCEHIKYYANPIQMHICVPLMAQSDIYGLLYVEIPKSELNPIHFNDDDILLLNAISEQIALSLANVRLRENLQFQSLHDPLTGLHNRRYLDEYMAREISRAKREETPLAVMMLDLDHFKKFNDTYGHEAGNLLLKELGRVFLQNMRPTDCAARYGGEEFVLVLNNMSPELALDRAEKLRQEVSCIHLQYGPELIGCFGISIGISIYPLDGITPEELIKTADQAMYYAKRTGRNKVTLFSTVKQELNPKLNNVD